MFIFGTYWKTWYFYGLWTSLPVPSQKWTKACDKRLARLIAHTHHTCEYRQYYYVGKHSTTLQMKVCFKTLILQETWKTRNQHQQEFFSFSEVHTFVPLSWMCKKQNSVSHSSTEAEVISLQAGLRMDGVSCSRSLGFSDWSISFLTKPNQQNQRCKRVTEKLVGKHSTKHAKTNSNHEHQSGSDQHWSRSIKRNTFWFQCYVVCLWG